MWLPKLKKIVSGGQSGVDRGSLDAAIALGIPHGGWCPYDRRAEDGPIADRYQLQCTRSADYRVRTRRNVLQSDGTLIFACGEPTGGTKLTRDWAICCGRPCQVVDFIACRQRPENASVAQHAVRDWLYLHSIRVLNVGGPRGSRHAWLAESTRTFMCRMLRVL